MRVLSFSETGNVRKHNEDRYLALPEVGLFAVADGMGGELAGEVAAQMALDQLVKNVSQLESLGQEQLGGWLERVLSEANRDVFELAGKDADKKGMGTTLTVLLTRGKSAWIAHVGDSRAYLWRDGSLLTLTEDHSLVGELVRLGQITAEQAETHPQRHLLVRAVGAADAVQIDSLNSEILPRDVFLLCTDGVSNSLNDAELAAELAYADSWENRMIRIQQKIWERGAKDNFTAVLCMVE